MEKVTSKRTPAIETINTDEKMMRDKYPEYGCQTIRRRIRVPGTVIGAASEVAAIIVGTAVGAKTGAWVGSCFVAVGTGIGAAAGGVTGLLASVFAAAYVWRRQTRWIG